MGCDKRDSRKFSSEETELYLPESRILGSVMFLPEISENEIGFFLGGSLASNDRVIVTLTRRDYLCQSFTEDQAKKRCLTREMVQRSRDKANEIVKTYTNEERSTWVYGRSGDSAADSLATCRSIAEQPRTGRCFTEGRYKDIAYSAIFYDLRSGGVLKVRADVEKQIMDWDAKAAK
jgi:hypothetical protein